MSVNVKGQIWPNRDRPQVTPKTTMAELEIERPASARRRTKTPPAAQPASARGATSRSPLTSSRSWRTAETPRLGTPTRADSERAKVEAKRRAEAQAAKDERLRREALLQQRQRARCNSVHHAACELRANTSAAVRAQRSSAEQQRSSAALEVKRAVEELRQQLVEQKAQWTDHGREVYRSALATRRAASSARNNVREHNLSEAHRASAERLDLFRQSAEAQSALNDGKRLMAERVRREAGLGVVRGAFSRLTSERGANAAELRRKSEAYMLDAEYGRLQTSQSKVASARGVELVASPARVRQLKSVEERRKAGLTGALREQNRALEALALERRADEAAARQRMHDAIVCAKYGMPHSALSSINPPI